MHNFNAFYFLSLTNFFLVGTSHIMLNKSDASKQFCLFDLTGKIFCVLALSVLLSVSFSFILYYAKVHSVYIHFVESFYHEWMFNFVTCLLHPLRWSYDFYSSFFNVVYYFNWFAHIEPSLNLWNTSHLLMEYDPFNVLLNLVC